jgi:hypothetical protein
VEESCLSVPGIVGNVIRRTRVRVRAQDCRGEVFESDVDGMHAVCLQHEIDHLDGRLFIDRLSWFKKLRLRLSGAAAVLETTSCLILFRLARQRPMRRAAVHAFVFTLGCTQERRRCFERFP